MKRKDRLYAQHQEYVSDFEFNENVASVFYDMIRRSVPGYGSMIANIGLISSQYIQPNSVCYDLGCSLGAVVKAIDSCLEMDNVTLVAVDQSYPMIKKCKQNLATTQSNARIHYLCADIGDINICNASVVILNLTLQFIPLKQREVLLSRIYNGMNKGGVLVLSEKLVDSTLSTQQLFDTLHAGFKRANGYSELEISQKRSALENVLVSESLDQHISRLQRVGFRKVIPWFQCLNFSSLLVFK